MRYTFNYFKKLLFESILDEDKSRLINKLVLPDIEDEEEKQKARDEINSFFKRYSNYENKLDWNKLDSITYADFEKVKELANKSKGAHKREIASDIKNIFKSVGDRKFEIVGETEDWLFIAPLTWEAAVYCDSSENQGAGAKWCIGYEGDDQYWSDYINEGSSFIMAFNKNYKSMNNQELKTNLKYMIQRKKDGNYIIWNQADKEDSKLFNIFDNALLYKLFSKLEKIKKAIANEVEKTLKVKVKNLENMSEIPENYFISDERKFLKEITIPGNIKNIGGGAFELWENLENATIKNGVETIGLWAFGFCSKLKTIIIPDSVITIRSGAFQDCHSLTNIKLSNNLKTIGSDVFRDCYELSNITIPASVVSIGDHTFYCDEYDNDFNKHNSKLKSITFKGKSMDEIKQMDYYPWGIENPEEVIKAEK